MLKSAKTAFVLSAGILAGTLSPAFAQPTIEAAAQEKAQALEELALTFSRILQQVEDHSAVHPDTQALARQAIDELLKKIDPHTSYMDAGEFKKMRESTSGEFGGLGLQVFVSKKDPSLPLSADNRLTIEKPIDNTPASKAGLVANDIITHVNGTSLEGLTLEEAVTKMRGKEGTDVTLTVERAGTALPPITMTRAIIEQSPVKHVIVGNVGVVSMSSFNEKSAQDINKAVETIKTQLGAKFAGLVLELDINPGGLLNQAIAVSDLFLDGVMPITHTGTTKGIEETFFSSRGDIIDGKPLVVTITGSSASASEIVAGALQDNKRATILGLQSFGKGSVQTIMPLSSPNEGFDLGGLRLTTALYYTASRDSIQGIGITPDILFESEDIRKMLADPEYQKMKRTEASLDGMIANPNLVADNRQTKEVCEPAQGVDESKTDENLKFTLPDGTMKVDYMRACAVETVLSQSALTITKPYIQPAAAPSGPR